jgi:hypothetical protein
MDVKKESPGNELSAELLETKDVTRNGLRSMDGSHWKLKHGISTQACGQPPRAHIFFGLHHAMLSVEVDQIDGEPHKEGMDRLAGNNPQTVSSTQRISPEQALTAVAAASRNLQPVGQL